MRQMQNPGQREEPSKIGKTDSQTAHRSSSTTPTPPSSSSSAREFLWQPGQPGERTANSKQRTADGGRRTARLSERVNIAQPSKSRPSPQSGLQPSAKPIKNAKQRILEYRQALPSTAKPQATSIIHAKSPER
ncbi:uncharacterized protein PADG_07309 [Paracoccidioides brasiliensis Pb18]|uniref:Uncharacterized protein n=1 Tax=Paracoccidioides brasiliensis (strain Pb18) TaxID=502780 RepID=C1GJ73_PARBD|nr:uncharacterized protein PADG_07309 [Paracoccidioides brasiliensis Pb18]EEH42489.2 hypothetical protein PADG_07309 [Paracoccidioides brasiliensis Pb18]